MHESFGLTPSRPGSRGGHHSRPGSRGGHQSRPVSRSGSPTWREDRLSLRDSLRATEREPAELFYGGGGLETRRASSRGSSLARGARGERGFYRDPDPDDPVSRPTSQRGGGKCADPGPRQDITMGLARQEKLGLDLGPAKKNKGPYRTLSLMAPTNTWF